MFRESKSISIEMLFDFDKAAKARLIKINKPFCLPCKGCGCNLLHSEGLEKWQGHRVLAIFGAFRLLLGGSTHVQHPLAKYEIYLTFSKSYVIYFLVYLSSFVNNIFVELNIIMIYNLYIIIY